MDEIWLVVWLPSIFYFPMTIGLLIIPTDELIFFRGVAQPPTRYGFYGWNRVFRLDVARCLIMFL